MSNLMVKLIRFARSARRWRAFRRFRPEIDEFLYKHGIDPYTEDEKSVSAW